MFPKFLQEKNFLTFSKTFKKKKNLKNSTKTLIEKKTSNKNIKQKNLFRCHRSVTFNSPDFVQLFIMIDNRNSVIDVGSKALS